MLHSSSWVEVFLKIICFLSILQVRLCAVSLLFTLSKAVLNAYICVLFLSPVVRLAFCTYSLAGYKVLLTPPLGTCTENQLSGVGEMCGALGVPMDQLRGISRGGIPSGFLAGFLIESVKQLQDPCSFHVSESLGAIPPASP